MKNHFKKFFFVLVLSCTSFLLGAFLIITEGENLITRQIINDAGKLIGLQFNEAKVDSMIEGLNDQIKNYEEIREYPLSNSVMPSVLFNPIPVGFKITEKQKPFVMSNYSGTKIPENKNGLAFYSIGQLANLLKTKQITSVELTKFYLDRLKKYGPKLQCVITLTEERAMKEAKEADKEIAAGKYRGPLMGIPYGVKDLLATKQYKTTWGAMPFKGQVIDEDASVIKKLHNAGAVLVAKLTLGALAMGDFWFDGQTKNPWDTTQGSSGSSAGPASATSAGLVPFALGTETLGSIVSPSTVCGVTGLRPTYGRVSRTGAMALSWSMDKIGPLCRSAEDCAIVFNVIHGADGIDQTLYNYPFNYTPKVNLEGMKIGYLKSDFDDKYAFHDNDSVSLEALRKLGVILVPIKLPDIPVRSLRIILTAEGAAAFDEMTRSEKDDLLTRQGINAWPNTFRKARFIPAVEYINANRIRNILIQEMEKVFKDNKIDLYVAPSWNGINLTLTNLTGNPCVVLPNGFSKRGTPTSISFIGNLFNEGKLIAAAKAYQDATGFQLKHPVINW